MAHGLTDYDWMFSVKEKPWHGIGSVIEDAPNSEEAIRIAKLDWEVIQVPIVAQTERGYVPIKDNFATIRTDLNTVLGTVKSRYEIVQNTEAFRFVDRIIGEDCKYETAGSLFEGRKVFLLTRLPEIDLLGDKVENYLFFTTSHDGTSSVTAGVSSVRVVCNNTLNAALASASRLWRCKHTKNVKNTLEDIENAKKTLELKGAYINALKQEAEDMYAIKIDDNRFIRSVLKDNPFGVGEETNGAIVERVVSIYDSKDDLANFQGTAWGWYNAMADMLSNTKPLREVDNANEKRLNSFFQGNAMLDKMKGYLLDFAA